MRLFFRAGQRQRIRAEIINQVHAQQKQHSDERSEGPVAVVVPHRRNGDQCDGESDEKFLVHEMSVYTACTSPRRHSDVQRLLRIWLTRAATQSRELALLIRAVCTLGVQTLRSV